MWGSLSPCARCVAVPVLVLGRSLRSARAQSRCSLCSARRTQGAQRAQGGLLADKKNSNDRARALKPRRRARTGRQRIQTLQRPTATTTEAETRTQRQDLYTLLTPIVKRTHTQNATHKRTQQSFPNLCANVTVLPMRSLRNITIRASTLAIGPTLRPQSNRQRRR